MPEPRPLVAIERLSGSVYDLLTGFRDPPAGVQMGDGMYYNLAFPGHQLAMPPPLANENFVDYQPDAGAKGSLDRRTERREPTWRRVGARNGRETLSDSLEAD